jgi:4-amino-4-deoxy-L-arabinose transferase-like glycosyltransferase
MPRRRRLGPLPTSLLCAGLIVLFAYLSYRAILTKSATLDEPLHVASAYAATYLHDYRLDPENPPLWKYWAMLPVRRGVLPIDETEPRWQHLTSPDTGQIYTTRLLYQTPSVDGIGIINSSRGAMVLIGIAVIAIAAAWAYRLADPFAAIATTFLLALDPTFLAHAAIVKNDVAMVLLMLLLMIALCRTLRAMTPLNVVALGVVCGAAMGVKFSGIVWPFIAAIVLVGRAQGGHPWPLVIGIRGRMMLLRSRIMRTIAAIISLGTISLASLAVVWCSYGLRYSVGIDPASHIDIPQNISDIATLDLAARLGHVPTAAELSAWQTPASVRAILWFDRHRLLPQPFSAGLIGVYREMLRHTNYLLGEVRIGRGWWYYFPLAMLLKLPLATLVVFALATVVLISRRVSLSTKQRRGLLAIAAATVVYLVFAMMQSINHGVRHMLPVYALFAVAAGLLVARSRDRWPKPTVIVTSILALGLLAESLASYPNYLAFFNLAVGGSRGGLHLLGDSNLDWGQDLPLLAEWQRRHPDVRIYNACYGTADPAAYGIAYTNIFGGFYMGPPLEPLTTPGVIAISATHLQRLFLPLEQRSTFERLHNQPVREVLGGTIYLYDYPLK